MDWMIGIHILMQIFSSSSSQIGSGIGSGKYVSSFQEGKSVSIQN